MLIRYPAMKQLKWILGPLLLVAAWLAVEAVLRHRAQPPTTVRTLDDYLRWQTRHPTAVLAEINGRTSLLMYGPRSTLLLQAGPPVYAFDGSGRLVDWTADCGRDRRFQNQWLFPPMRATKVPAGEVRERLAAIRPTG
jgi:hypothetical protein